eukprot:CAMPEP_0194061298 /NCGR_PEP_ID=MMETSP0009_2-20130614/74233_1 /TAXON_ID=210454 /ORGANISM="Grammatophora oceanica, Strain CCMP 410" /LENGTH=93 /DNA_ID=CAMNT_0038712563 /DNA_START=11 /DNA_END=289 /DNA_ORIENTATION=-
MTPPTLGGERTPVPTVTASSPSGASTAAVLTRPSQSPFQLVVGPGIPTGAPADSTEVPTSLPPVSPTPSANMLPPSGVPSGPQTVPSVLLTAF